MFMWLIHIALALGLIALMAGAALVLWSRPNAERGSLLFKGIGYFIIIVAVLNLICIGYCAMRDWKAGQFNQPNCAMKSGMYQCHGMNGQERQYRKEDTSGAMTTDNQNFPSANPSNDMSQKMTKKSAPSPHSCTLESDGMCRVPQPSMPAAQHAYDNLIKA